MENPTNLHLTGFIKEIEYQSYLNQPLKEVSCHGFNINNVPSYGLINLNGQKIAYSKWVSPKRSRGYPLARVYEDEERGEIGLFISNKQDMQLKCVLTY